MLKIGLSISKENMNSPFFEECAASGIDCIELSPTAEENPGLEVAAICADMRRAGVEPWSYHLPFSPFEELDISMPKLVPYSLALLTEYIRRAGDAGIVNYVLHSSGEPIDDSERRMRMETAKESLYKLSEVARAAGGRLLVENLPRTVLGKNSDELLELISVHPDMRVVFDTNHLLAEDPIEFIKKVGAKIVSTHVSDYDKIDEKHWLPGEGVTDFYAIFSALRDIGYSGPWLYELSLTNTPKRTRSRNLTPLDIVKNAKEIFENKPLTVIN